MTINSVPLRVIIKMRARPYDVSNFDYEIAEVCFINVKHTIITCRKIIGIDI